MSSEASNEFNTTHSDRVGKIRGAAVAPLKELDRLRSAGPMTKEALDAEVARIAREKLQPYGCDLVVHRMGDGVTRLLIKGQKQWEREYDLVKSFYHPGDGSILEAEA
jgi:hypothetical protein